MGKTGLNLPRRRPAANAILIKTMARDNRIDSLKGLLIILVILGHVITTIDNVNIVNHAVMGFIYIFHMPLFILISGYLTKPPQQQSSGSLFRSLGNLLVTLIIFHIYYFFLLFSLYSPIILLYYHKDHILFYYLLQYFP